MSRSPSPRCAATLAALLLGLAPLAGAGQAGAQEDPSTTSSTEATTSTTTSTTAPPDTTSPTLLPPPPGETTTTTTPEHAGDQDSPPETVPLTEQTVPPPPGEAVDPLAAQRLIRREIDVARAEAVASEVEVQEAAALVDQLTERLAALQRELAQLDVAQQLAVQELRTAQERFQERVANAVVRGNAAELDTVLTSVDANEIQTRKVFLESVSEADSESVVAVQAAKDAIDRGVLDALDSVARTRRELRDARAQLQQALLVNTEHKFQLAVFAAGSEIVIRGFVFPVGEPYSFIDSWGYPRMTGTEYEHGHQGVDIMAPFGTPLYAVERGVITRVGTDVLGGTKLWLKGQSGTYYYYAHLSAYAEGMVEGAVVDAGHVVGFVGDTGNAAGGAPHLHFQVHPGGGEPVNPYGLLRVVSDLSRR